MPKFGLRRQFLVLCATILVAACASGPQGYSDFDIQTDFSGYKSFSWLAKNPMFVASPDPVNPALEGILMNEVKSNLTRQGFVFVADPENADMVIGFTVGASDGLRSNIYPGRYRQFARVGAVDDWRTTVDTRDVSDGGIVIDIFEQSSAEKKWMGWASTEITYSDSVDVQPVVRQLVTAILQHFPPNI